MPNCGFGLLFFPNVNTGRNLKFLQLVLQSEINKLIVGQGSILKALKKSLKGNT